MTLLWEPKGDQIGSTNRPFFAVFLKASVNIDGGCDCRARVVLSPADPPGRALKSKDTIVQYGTNTDERKYVNVF